MGAYETEQGIFPDDSKNDFYAMLEIAYPEQYERMYQFGRRNVSWSTIAPTGSVSILTQTTSGCEPLFMPYYMRRKKVNPSDKNARVDFVDQNGDSWTEFPVLHPKFKYWLETQYMSAGESAAFSWTDVKYLEKAFQQSPYYGATANDINWKRRVEMQAILQKYTTNAISSTINLPNNISVQEVDRIYMMSWRYGLKGQTIYRDGCRTGVLVSNSEKNLFEYKDAPKRPQSLPGEGYIIKKSGEEYLIVVGLFGKNAYEVFAMPNEWNITKKFSCDIVKMKKGHYDLLLKDDIRIENFTSAMNEEQEILSRLISTSLRHGADIKFIVEQLQKSEGDLTSFSKVIARVLKNYIPDGAQSTLTCESCGSKSIIFEEGCLKCQDCGNSKCS